MRGTTFLMLFLLQASLVAAATVHGTVYNIDLNPVKNVKVELTSPKQVFIAINGTYSFNVPAGTYTLTAKLIKNGTVDASASEVITAINDNDYVLDLILFPELDYQSDILTESEQINIDEVKDESSTTWLKVSIGVLIVLGLLWYFLRKPVSEQHETSEPKENITQDDAQRVLDIIKAQGGRTTQKEIRKQTPLSEAKVSLIIAELEHKGQIQKIKQGRGNIVILK